MASQSPIIDKPLRLPGQTLDEKIEWWTNDGVIGYFLAVAVFLGMAIMEWVGYLRNPPRQSIIYSICAVVAIVALVARILYVQKQVRQLRLGRDGERVVGQFLEAFCVRGGRIFHDVPGGNFNVDHVLICPQGIYAIETKTWSKPWPVAKVVARDGKLVKAGCTPDRDANDQALHAAGWLQSLLESKVDMPCPVRPVVVIPGWSVSKGLEHGTVCVIEPKDFPDYLSKRPVTLTDREVRLLSAHLSRYIRATQRMAKSCSGLIDWRSGRNIAL